MSSGKCALTAALVMLSFLAVAAVQSWPLPLHLSTHLTGDPGGDTGVYVWNTWVFSHEIFERHRWPFSTGSIFGLSGPVDLGLHNYTVFSNLLALPLQPIVGVVGAFNVTYLVNVALAGLGVFMLVRRVGRTWPVASSDAWLAGMLFACSPFIVARSTAHFSLVAAAPLPFFALCLDRLWEERRVRDGVLTGACIAWAAYCDVYYAVYCVLIAAVLLVPRVASVALNRRGRFASWVPAFDVPIALLVAAIGGVGIIYGGVLHIGSLVVSMRTLYTPVLILTVLAAGRSWWIYRPDVRWQIPPLATLATPALATALTGGLLLAPVFYSLAIRTVEGRFVHPPVLWRSSPPGVDLASFVVPNPNHPLAPERVVSWLRSEPGRYEENVASIPWIVLAIVAVAWRRAGYRPDRGWALALGFFALLALGPFIRIAGIDTYVPTPWTFLRYLPVVGEARMPPRFVIVVMMATCVVFAGALAAIRRRNPTDGRWLTPLVALVLVAELWPAPRSLHAATVADLFDIIARDPRPVRVLSLPIGVRDGLSSLGDFSARTLVEQTTHGKPIVGGYLSRVSQGRKERNLADPVFAALILKSEGRTISEAQRAAARREGAAFLKRSGIGWVVIDETRASAPLRALAVDALHLTLKRRAGRYALYEPAHERTSAP